MLKVICGSKYHLKLNIVIFYRLRKTSLIDTDPRKNHTIIILIKMRIMM